MPKKKTVDKKKSSLNPSNLTEKAYKGIRHILFHNEIAPGQKIAYHYLTKRLNMSPTPIIQALKLLEVQGLVRHEPNRGYYTAPTSFDEVEEIYEMREIIEVSLLSKTMNSLGKNEIQKHYELLKEHSLGLDSDLASNALSSDKALHLTLASLSGSRVQLRILRQLFDLLYLKYRHSVLFATSFEDVNNQHQNIIDLVMLGESQKAKQALSDHICDIKNHVLNGLTRIMQEKEHTIF